MYKLVEKLVWHDNHVDKPANQDIMCVVVVETLDHTLQSLTDLHFWNGCAWWPSNGDYGFETDDGRWISNGVDDGDVARWCPIIE